MEIIPLLRAELETEVAAGFPRLGRVPQTGVCRFLDYFGDLGQAERAELLDALAQRAAPAFGAGGLHGVPSPAAFERYWKATTTQGPYCGGYRYCDVKFLASIPKVKEFGGYEGWVEKFQRPWASERALTPRADLLPSFECLVPVAAPVLKKLVKSVLQAKGYSVGSAKGAEHTYYHPSGAEIHMDFGSRLGQIRYGIAPPGASARVSTRNLESLWGQVGGWDYLTEENAPRSVEFLTESIDYLVALNERISALPNGSA